MNRHPEWFETFKLVIGPYKAGLLQDEKVVWVSLSVPDITDKMEEAGCKVSEYFVRQMLERMGFRRRSLSRNHQHRHQEEGKVMAIGQPKSLDHDFVTFSDGQIVPHGIYDVTNNLHGSAGFRTDIQIVTRQVMKKIIQST